MAEPLEEPYQAEPYQAETRSSETEKFLAEVESLKALRSSRGYEVLRSIIRHELSKCWLSFLEEVDDGRLRQAAFEGRAVFGVLRAIDADIREGDSLGWELAERAREAEARGSEPRDVSSSSIERLRAGYRKGLG